jgi:hypothetical protein
MAKQKRKKMTTADAVKILAHESKQIQDNLRTIWDNIQCQEVIQKDTIALFEHYLAHTKDGKSFIKKMEKLLKETMNEQNPNERVNEENTTKSSKSQKIGAK